jgi:protocatechuate 3,4-dioxygenase beta subunit
MWSSILVSIALLLQGANGLQSNAGAISGVLKTTAGRPAVGVRVTAMAALQSPLDAVSSFSMVSLSETDINGRYHLENIPPGRYYITAGSVDNPTYFPGTMDLARGTIVSVTAQASIFGIDFVQQDSSIRAASTFSVRPALSVPVVVQIEGGGRQPVFFSGEFVTLRVIRTVDASRTSVHLGGGTVRAVIPSPVPGSEYRLTVDNLPDGYAVKSMTYGSTNLMTDTLKLTDINFSQLQPLSSIQGGAGIIMVGNCTVLLPVNGASPSPTVNINGATVSLPLPVAIGSCMTGNANSSVIITLAATSPFVPPVPGARISGKMPFQSGDWTIYSDSVPGVLYADGSYEIRGVTPGRHIVMMQSEGLTPQYYAALVTIGDKDLEGVTLENIEVWPANPVALSETTGATGPGSFRSPAGLKGRVLEAAGGKPLKGGSVTILGSYMTTTSINADGKFIFPHLLPGRYDLRIEAYEHFTLYETVVIGEGNVEKSFAVRSSLSDDSEVR